MSEQTRTGATTQRPECQQARAPLYPTCTWQFFQAAGVTFQWASGLSFCGVLPPSLSLLSFFSAGFSGVVLKTGGAAVATSAIRGESRGGCAASPCSGKVPPDSRGQWHQEHRAPTREPCNSSGIPSPVFCTQLGIAVFIGLFWDFGLHQP